MGYVKGYAYDIFISYARVDDEEDVPGGLNWVSTFEKYLTRALRKRLSQGDNLTVFFDRRTVNSNDVLTELEEAARASAVFLAVCSPNYAEREWTRKELAAFSAASDDSKRLFAVEVLPLDPGETYPEALQERIREPFMVPTSDVGTTMMPLPPEHPEFGKKIHDMAEQIRQQLLVMQVVTDVQEATGIPGQPKASGRTVVLGQVTDDLEAERDQLRRHLEQFGHDVRPKGYMRQDGAGFMADVAEVLTGADLYVQLLGPVKGRMPPDLPEGYVRAQLSMAEDAGVRSMLWRSAEMRMDAVADADHRDLLTAENVVTSGLESFKALVLEALADSPAQPRAATGDESLMTIFIHADAPDLEYAKTVKEEFDRRGFLTEITLADDKGPDYKDYLYEQLIECDGLVLLYGNTNEIWPRKNLKHFNKLRARRAAPPKLVAVYVGPPKEKDKDLGIGMPGLQVVGSRQEWRPDAIKELIDSFHAGGA